MGVKIKTAIVLLLTITSEIILCAETCINSVNNNQVCPTGNTCCKTKGQWGCIPNDMPGNKGVCCPDGKTGCAPGYICSDDSSNNDICRRDNSQQQYDDPLVEIMPRYSLCSPPTESPQHIYGLPMAGNTPCPAVAYYSSMGDIVSQSHFNAHKAVLVIHGDNHNADDYFCSTTRASTIQTWYPSDQVLVLAPRFLAIEDGPVIFVNSSSAIPMRWQSGSDDNAGTWRYGASAVYPLQATDISSFDVMDEFLTLLSDPTRFPYLESVTVVGHSSGAQFVQRWALLSSSTVFNDNTLPIRVVVANPSSYIYLDAQRYINGTFQIPSPSFQRSCPQYNQWHWGLDKGTKEDVPYKDHAIDSAGGLPQLRNRYLSRQVLYLIGSNDRCNVTGDTMTGWCYSHGLETTCMDQAQGHNRFERSFWYYASLMERNLHRHFVVNGVGHDHTLMFQSSVGLSAIFSFDGNVLQAMG